MGRPDFRPPESRTPEYPPYDWPPQSRTPEYPPYDWPPTAVVPGIANPGRRLVARIIDGLIVTVTVVLLATPLIAAAGTAEEKSGETPGWMIAAMMLILFGGYFSYEPIQLALWGRTLGKRIMKLRIAPADAPDAPLPGARGFGRGMTYPLLFSVIGIFPLFGLVSLLNALWLLWDMPLRQCLHDKIAGTVVVNAPRRR